MLSFTFGIIILYFFTGCISATVGIDTRQNSGCNECNKQYVPVPYPAYMPPPQQGGYYDGF